MLAAYTPFSFCFSGGSLNSIKGPKYSRSPHPIHTLVTRGNSQRESCTFQCLWSKIVWRRLHAWDFCQISLKKQQQPNRALIASTLRQCTHLYPPSKIFWTRQPHSSSIYGTALFAPGPVYSGFGPETHYCGWFSESLCMNCFSYLLSCLCWSYLNITEELC